MIELITNIFLANSRIQDKGASEQKVHSLNPGQARLFLFSFFYDSSRSSSSSSPDTIALKLAFSALKSGGAKEMSASLPGR